MGETGVHGLAYAQFETAVLGAPGVMAALDGTSPHPYAQEVWIPWLSQPWGNESFFYANETMSKGGNVTNSTVALVGAVAELMVRAATAAGLAGSVPVLHPSEMGYNLLYDNSVSGGWAVMHAALTAQLLLHMRSTPLAQFVRKAFLFAAYDGCCAESGGFFGIWRSGQLRLGPRALEGALEDACERPVAPQGRQPAKGQQPVEIRRELPGDPADEQSRYLEAAIDGLIVACLYLPNGNPQPGPKFDYKLDWMERLRSHAAPDRRYSYEGTS